MTHKSPSHYNFIPSLTQAQMKTQKIEDIDEIQHLLSPEWFEVLKSEFDYNYWDDIIAALNSGPYLPKKLDLFNALNHCPPNKVKVVILGQDPYIHENEACGYSFSVPTGTGIPPSLRNIFNELMKEYNQTIMPRNGKLTSWEDDGVLLLNTIMTVKPNASRSHANIGWEHFTDAIIRYIDNHNKCVFLAWGSYAQKMCSERVVNNKILMAGHPSPLNTAKPFVGCNCFKDCNELLKSYKLLPIRWLSIFE